MDNAAVSDILRLLVFYLRLLLLEGVLLLAALAMALAVRVPRVGLLRAGGRWFRRLARRRRLAVLLVGLLSAAGAAGLSLLVYGPAPRYHDEFSYLLAADTFARGRLTNPTHPHWAHFESFHIIHRPSYMSKYPPGQGLALAAGQALAGHPVVGVWLSVGLCCGAICWMLQGWLPPRWALAGALLAAGRLVFAGASAGTVGYWGHSYWGGAVAALGGALVFGALRRLVRRPAAGQAALLGVGLAIMANSRPFEGLVVSLPVAALLAAWLAGKAGPAPGVALKRVLLPLAAVLAPAAVVMGCYNHQVTGDPLVLPYRQHESTYAVAPSFLWHPPRPEPPYHHALMRSFWTGWACEAYREQQSPSGLGWHLLLKAFVPWLFFLGITLTAALAALPQALRDRWTLFAGVTCALLVGALLLESGVLPHYAAPGTCLVFLLVTQSLRRLRLWCWRGRPAGRVLAGGLVLNCVLLWVLSVRFAALTVNPSEWFRQRAQVHARLEGTPGRHLVIVRYGPAHLHHCEWVYNEADIDGARVVWAREMGTEHDRALLEYFRDRRAWLLEPDAQPPRLVPYPGAETPRGGLSASVPNRWGRNAPHPLGRR